MNDYIAPWLAVPLILMAWTILAVIIRVEVRRERASSQSEVVDTLAEAESEDRSTAAVAMHRVRKPSDARSEMGGRTQASSGARRSSHAGERGTSAQEMQQLSGRQARRAGDELATTASARHPRVVTR